MKIQITLRSGTQIEADVEEFTIGRGGLSGEMRELQWVNPPDALRKLKYLDINDVVAVVAIHEPSAQDSKPNPES